MKKNGTKLVIRVLCVVLAAGLLTVAIVVPLAG